jgi:hypothetical protein
VSTVLSNFCKEGKTGTRAVSKLVGTIALGAVGFSSFQSEDSVCWTKDEINERKILGEL